MENIYKRHYGCEVEGVLNDCRGYETDSSIEGKIDFHGRILNGKDFVTGVINSRLFNEVPTNSDEKFLKDALVDKLIQYVQISDVEIYKVSDRDRCSYILTLDTNIPALEFLNK